MHCSDPYVMLGSSRERRLEGSAGVRLGQGDGQGPPEAENGHAVSRKARGTLHGLHPHLPGHVWPLLLAGHGKETHT